MKYFYFLLMLFFAFSCSTQKDNESQIYEDYVDSFYKVIVQTKFDVPFSLVPPQIGDTIKITKDFNLLSDKNDSIITLGEEILIPIKIDDRLIFTDSTNGWITLQKLDNQAEVGSVHKRIFDQVTNHGYFIKKRLDYYDQLQDNKKKQIELLKSKYKLTEQELLNILAKENKKRTGQNGFSFF